jgi:TetR/AcrR family transcriptional regulator
MTVTRRRMPADQRRREVLAAAVAAFAEGGYAGTTTDDVARRAGVSQPYVVRMFGTKQALFLAVYEESTRRVQDGFRAAAAAGGTGHRTSGGSADPASGGSADPASGGSADPASGGSADPASGRSGGPSSERRDGPGPDAAGDPLAVLGDAYLALIADRDLLRVMQHGFVAGSDPVLGPAMRAGMTSIYRLVRELTGATAEQARDFLARGMLINTLVALERPDHLDEDPAGAELFRCTLEK